MVDRIGGMLDTVGILIRNPGARKSRATLNAARRGIYAWRRDNPDAVCAWCGRDDQTLDGHHLYPVSLFPEYAEDPTNIVGLCGDRGCHLLVGHQGSWSGAFAPNLARWRVEPLVYIRVEFPR